MLSAQDLDPFQQHLLGGCSLVTEDGRLMVALEFVDGISTYISHVVTSLLLTLEPELSKAKVIVPRHADQEKMRKRTI